MSTIREALTTITAQALGTHVAALTESGPRHPGTRGSAAAVREYLVQAVADSGARARVEAYGRGLHDVNFVVELPGRTDEWYELAAHWDTVPDSPGADDNASGVAGVLAALRVLATFDRPGAGIRCCLFGGEEAGFQGSQAHVARTSEAAGAIVLEMIGYRCAEPGSQRSPAQLRGLLDLPDAGTFIGLVADGNSAGLLAAVQAGAERYVPELATVGLQIPVQLTELVSRSDHVPYWWCGRRALLVTDTADYRNPHYHRPTDTLDTLDLDFAAQVTRAVTGAVATLAGCQPGG